MDLPQELLDEIFGHLPTDGGQSLRACSLVAKPWVDPAQRRLFSSVTIALTTYQSWMTCISPTNTKLLRNVRSLCCFVWDLLRLDGPIPDIEDLIDYFPSLCQLQSLILFNLGIEVDFPLEMFSPLRHTLSSLSIYNTFLPWATFIMLLDCFPHLRNLKIRDPGFIRYLQQQPPLSRPLCGSLSMSMFSGVDLAIFSSRLPGTHVAYDELVIHGNPADSMTLKLYQNIIDVCGKNLKYLRLMTCEFMIQCVRVGSYYRHRLMHVLNSQWASLRLSRAVQSFASSSFLRRPPRK